MSAWWFRAKSCPNLVTPWTVACQAPLSMGFSRQEYWSGLPFLSPGNLPDFGIKPRSPALQADFSLTKLRTVLNSVFTKTLYIDFPPTSPLEQFLRAIWGAASRDIVLTLPQIKLNWQFSCCAFSPHQGNLKLQSLFVIPVALAIRMLKNFQAMKKSLRDSCFQDIINSI